ncbi:MAG: M20/M25/M40 family metallo-hydrolase [Ornithinibacter sp.]
MSEEQPADDPIGASATALAVELVAIDSVNPGLVPGAAGESHIVQHLQARLDAAGFTTEVLVPDGHPDRPSLLAITPHAPASRAGPTVVLTGHLDTVGTNGMSEPLAARVEGHRLLGRGACDMKGGIAAMVAAAEELARTELTGRVVLALVADEEDLSIGTEAVIAALPGLGVRPDVAVVGEPTWLALARSLRGYAVVEVALTGRSAHSSQPEQGVNAVAHLGRLLAAVEARGGEIASGGGSLMATVAGGGESPFVLARSARVVIERRTVPGESADVALTEVQALLTEMRAVDPTVDASARLLVSREAWRLEDVGPAATLGDRLTAALGEAAPTEPFHAPYWMEAPLWQAAGIPALVCGPAGGGLHAADEWVDLRQVRRYAVALTTAVREWVTEHAH